MICFDEHVSPYIHAMRGIVIEREPKRLTFGQWCFHRVFVHAPDPLRYALAWVGFVDTVPYEVMGKLTHDGGIALWRWDFWRSGYAREWRDLRREGRL